MTKIKLKLIQTKCLLEKLVIKEINEILKINFSEGLITYKQLSTSNFILRHVFFAVICFLYNAYKLLV